VERRLVMSARKQALLHLTIVVLLALFTFGPLLATLGAAAVAEANGCQLDESGVHPCPVGGHDYGEPLATLGMMFWFTIVTVPVGTVLFIACLIVTMTEYARRARRRSGNWGSPRTPSGRPLWPRFPPRRTTPPPSSRSTPAPGRSWSSPSARRCVWDTNTSAPSTSCSPCSRPRSMTAR
jgi:hypothetical protein